MKRKQSPDALGDYFRDYKPQKEAFEPTEAVVQYVGNKNSQVFHVLTCDSVRDMKDKNKVEFYTREEALELNYKPCQRCNP